MRGNRRWLLGGVLGFVVWNAAFDLQVRRAGQRFVDDQLALAAHGRPVITIAEGFQPAVRRAAGVATVVTALLLAGAHLILRPNADR